MAENIEKKWVHGGTLSVNGLLQGGGLIYEQSYGMPWSMAAPLPPVLPELGLLAGPDSSASTSFATATPVSVADTTSATTTLPMTSTASLASSAGLVIDVSYAADVANAPTITVGGTSVNAVEYAASQAVAFLESEIRNNITINISLGWGTLGGTTTTVATNAVAENNATPSPFPYSYAQIRSALINENDTAALANLGTSDPTNGAKFYVPNAQAKALNLIISSSTIDGNVGLNPSINYTFDPSSGIAGGTYDAVGALEHEITEVMGRIESLGTYVVSGADTLLDLFRYSSSGAHEVTGTAATTSPGYFSLNGTVTAQSYQFNTPGNGGDAGDWASNVGANSFDAFVSSGTAEPVTATDLQVMQAIGYDVACFAAGTLLAGEHGPVAVEHLKLGDRVRAHFAGLTRVKWVGHRRIDCARHPDPLAANPVRIAPDAFGPGLPHRTLVLSPEHAVVLDGALIPIRMLANGGSIVQENAPGYIHYFHVELDRHDLLYAEGLPAESYLDTGNRAMFVNAGLPLLLHPVLDNDQTRRQRESCLPLLLDPARLEPIWRRLADRARQLGFTPPEIETTHDAALRLTVRGRTFRPTALTSDRCCFVVPNLDAGGRLVSRHMVPAVLEPWREDRRQLGVMISGITLHAGNDRIALAMDDPQLSDGWWAAERDDTTIWRWTNGDAALPELPGCRMVEFRLGHRLAYPLGEGRSGNADAAPIRRLVA